MQIVELSGSEQTRIDQAAALLVDGFSDTGSTAWKTQAAALQEVEESFQQGRISRVACDSAGTVLGWIGGISAYDGHVWEMHPLVVRRDHRHKGVGRALVADFEHQVRRRGGMTIYLGTDDENGRTSLGGVDLYPNVLAALSTIQNRARHPIEFYRKVGFVVVGVLPDANGFGKPDIFMAKRVASGFGDAERTI
jgi:aminoglycoside 6'-N-acetyltransferase I